MYKLTVVLATSLLSGCVAAPLVLTGVGAASVAVNETTGKTVSDHIVSSLNGRDCRISRLNKNEEVCQEDYGIQLKITNTGVTPSSTEEIQSRYR